MVVQRARGQFFAHVMLGAALTLEAGQRTTERGDTLDAHLLEMMIRTCWWLSVRCIASPFGVMQARLQNLTEATHMAQNFPALRAGISPETE